MYRARVLIDRGQAARDAGRVAALALALLVAMVGRGAAGDQVFRSGFVLGGTLASRQSQLDAFRQGMRELGYIEGVTLSSRSAHRRGRRRTVRRVRR